MQVFTAIKTFAVIGLLLYLTACGNSTDESARYQISADKNALDFSLEVQSEDFPSQTINLDFNGDGALVGFAPNAESGQWLSYSVQSTSATSATLTLSLHQANLLAPDTYQTTLRISTGDTQNTNLTSLDIPVSLTVWNFDIDNTEREFIAELGETEQQSQSASVIGLNSNWTTSTDASWLSVSPAAGEGAQTLTITVDPSGITSAGLNQANVTVTDATSGTSQTIPVSLAVNGLRLFTPQNGVALSSLGDIQRLTQSLTMLSNASTEIAWEANTNDAWLSAQKTGNVLTITADPTGLADGWYQGQITVSAQGVQSETVAVGFYVQAAASADVQVANTGFDRSVAAVTDPIRPWVYLLAGSQVHVYHVYSGALIGQTQDISPTPNNLFIRPDGSQLLALSTESATDDNGNTSITQQLTHITADTLALSGITLPSTLEASIQGLLRIQGQDVLVSRTLEFVAIEDGEQLGQTPQTLNDQVQVLNRLLQPRDTRDIIATSTGDQVLVMQMRYSDLLDSKVATTLSFSTAQSSNDLAGLTVNANASRWYAANSTNERYQFDGDTLTAAGRLTTDEDLETGFVALGQNATPWFLRLDINTGFFLFGYDDAGTETVNKSIVITAGTAQYHVSADGNRSLVLDAGNSGNDTTLRLITNSN